MYCRFSVNASKWQVAFIEKQDDKVSIYTHDVHALQYSLDIHVYSS